MNANSKQYIAGYDYAAGALLRGEETPQSLEDKVWEVEDFERGIFDASFILTRSGVIKDDGELK
jgi:hypothetical protein